MFDSKAGAKRTRPGSAIIQHQLRPAPSAGKVEITPVLAYVEIPRFEKANADEGILGGRPAVVHRTGHLQVLGHAAGSADRGRALHAAGGTQAIQSKVAKTRRWVEQQVEGIISALGVERAGTRPV